MSLAIFIRFVWPYVTFRDRFWPQVTFHDQKLPNAWRSNSLKWAFNDSLSGTHFLKCDFRCTRVLKVLQNGRWVFQWELKENLLSVIFSSDGYGLVEDRQSHIDQQTLVNHGNLVRPTWYSPVIPDCPSPQTFNWLKSDLNSSNRYGVPWLEPIQKSIESTLENNSGESRWNSESEMKEMRFMGSSAVTPAGLFALGGNGPGSFLIPMNHRYNCRTIRVSIKLHHICT